MNEKPEQRARRYRGDARSATCRKHVIGVTGALTALLTAVQVAATCASCHGDSLAGIDDAPPLTGPAFHKTWDGNALSSLFNRISNDMPSDNPGTLTKPQVGELAAFVLEYNGYPAGKVGLPTAAESLMQIKILP